MYIHTEKAHGMATPNYLLRTARKRRHWSQQDLAHQLNATRITINRWEQGKSFPSPHFRMLLSSIFNMSESELGLTGNPDERPEKSALVDLPLPRNLFFIGREQVLQQLHHSFMAEKKAAFAQVQTISGLRGIGKTQTALEYAYRFRDCYTNILWLRAETNDMLVADIVGTAVKLNIVSSDKQQTIDAFTTWLQTHDHWLLVIDNVESMALVYGILPTDFKGHVILTIQSQITGPFSHALDLEGLSVEEGALFLLRRAKLIDYDEDFNKASQEQQKGALWLSYVLGGHPLALEQVAAFIEETGCRMADYVQYFQDHQARLLDFRGMVGVTHHHTVFTTISLTLERVRHISPSAFTILCICAFLHPDDIPEEIFHHVSFGENPDGPDFASNPLALNDIFAILSAQALLKRDKKTHHLRIHRLVQIVLRGRMCEKEKRHWIQWTLLAIHSLFPWGEQDDDQAMKFMYNTILLHILTLCEHIESFFRKKPGSLVCPTLFKYADEDTMKNCLEELAISTVQDKRC
jgi:transcriptional regulator with XRE-family HTH domain